MHAHPVILLFYFLCMACTSQACTKPEEGLAHLKLQLQVVLSLHLGSGNEPWSSPRATSALDCLAITQPSIILFLSPL